MFAPALPSDLLVNVYINLNKLCLTVYQLHALQPNSTKVRGTPLTPHPQAPCSLLGLTGSDALLLRTSAQLEALCFTALGPCCKYGALEYPADPNLLHLGGWEAGLVRPLPGTLPLPPVSGAPSVWR